jgi:hypothetical protein
MLHFLEDRRRYRPRLSTVTLSRDGGDSKARRGEAT